MAEDFSVDQLLDKMIVGVGGVATFGRAIAANLLKMIPGAGTIVGGAISASTAAALTLTEKRFYVKEKVDSLKLLV
ncbi:MAG: hypothetical protein RIG63_28640 [Coleofasciculus chthonoplastes F3-SA18-01]|jgi:uncharacterized protein (DUF697 family)|uniref:hypothetical protein n=1 Tax=Coleofasciculus chthonoplastes TaxID=64178 RepID=UPI0032F62F2F